MPGVSRSLILRVNGVDLLIRIVDKHELCAFLDALGCAFTRAFVRAFDAALAVRDVPRPRSAFSRQRQSARKE